MWHLLFIIFQIAELEDWPVSGKIKLCKVVTTVNLPFPLDCISHLQIR